MAGMSRMWLPDFSPPTADPFYRVRLLRVRHLIAVRPVPLRPLPPPFPRPSSARALCPCIASLRDDDDAVVDISAIPVSNKIVSADPAAAAAYDEWNDVVVVVLSSLHSRDGELRLPQFVRGIGTAFAASVSSAHVGA